MASKTHSAMFPKGDMGAGKQGPFWADIGRNMVLESETPNGVFNSAAEDMGPMTVAKSPLQEHEGALNSPARTGNRGGTSGKKPVGA